MVSSTDRTTAEQIEHANATGLTPVVLLHGLDARVAGRSRDGGGGEGAPRGLRPQDDRTGGRPLRRGDRQAEEEAGRDRALLWRTADPDRRRTRPLGSIGRHRPFALPPLAAAAVL